MELRIIIFKLPAERIEKRAKVKTWSPETLITCQAQWIVVSCSPVTEDSSVKLKYIYVYSFRGGA